jgi:TonB family protein
MRRNMLTRLLCSVVVLGFAAAVPIQMQAASDLEQHLRDQYKGKTLVLRYFYRGDHLRYDSLGASTGSAHQGDWTIDGFARVTGLDVSSQRLTIQAERFFLGNTGQSFQFQQYFDKKKDNKKKKEKTEHKLRIEVEFGSGGVTAEQADALLSRIFLTQQDRLPELVPDYWKPCVLSASTGKSTNPAVTEGSSQKWKIPPTGGERYDACRFPAEFATIPGVISGAEEAVASETRASERQAARIGKGVTPPKPVFAPDPEFSEQARSEKYQGTAVLSITVDKAGKVRNIRIVRPLGFGLDEKAVETVSGWRFNPAKKDGAEIEMDLAVEVDFHLY